MSRVNPEQIDPNPSVRYYEWDGENGQVRFYDKKAEKNVACNLPFTFVLLNRLASVRGWHEASKSGIISNEVKDTREQVMTVRAFKGGTIAVGLYAAIKDKVTVAGGHYCANLYVGVRIGDEKTLSVAQLQLKGAGLGAWMDFEKDNRSELYTGGIRITGKDQGKNGKIVFQTPVFELIKIAKETDDEAGKLQEVVAKYLERYFAKTNSAKVAAAAAAAGEEPQRDAPDDADQEAEQQQAKTKGGGHDYSPEPEDDNAPF